MTILVRVAAVAAVTLALCVDTGTAQSPEDLNALKKEVDALKEGQTAIRKELQDIKNLLQAGPPAARLPQPPQEAVVSVDGAPIKGDKSAKLTLVEFTDYQ